LRRIERRVSSSENRASTGGSNGGGFVRKPEAGGYGRTHFAVGLTAAADTVEAIARSRGWQCTRRNRGPFHVIDVWAENESMVEILSPKPSRKAIRG
jgi:hypothetical protein